MLLMDDVLYYHIMLLIIIYESRHAIPNSDWENIFKRIRMFTIL